MWELLLLAIKNLTHRKLRSYLTILGVLIGIIAVVTLISLGQGMQEAIEKSFEEAGTNVAIVMGTSGGMTSPIMGLIGEKPLTEDDKEVIEKTKGVDQVAGVLMIPTSLKKGKESRDVFITGMDPGPTKKIIEEGKNYEIEAGRDLEKGDKYKIVVGYNTAHKLFSRELRVGEKVEIFGKEFRIVGIYEKIGSKMDDNSVVMPLDVMRDLVGEKEKLGIIMFSAKKGYDIEEVAKRVEEKLRDHRNEKEGEETFSVSTSKDLIKTFKSILNIVQIVVVGLAAISLLVGGVGIMNTMYMAVMERTREIGTMKAIGAKNWQIMFLFLTESGILGMIGGIVGVVVGITISKIVEIIGKHLTGSMLLHAYISPALIIGSIVFSFIVGMVSGLMPAKQASNLKPVEALRYE